MNKTIFLSLIAGALLFTGCGGGGDDTTTTTTQPGSSSTEPVTEVTITVNPDNSWSIKNDTRSFPVADINKTYSEAEAFCTEQGYVLPSAIDLIAADTLPRVDGSVPSVVWAKDQFIEYTSTKSIGKPSDPDIRYAVICMDGESIDKKHPVNENSDGSVTDTLTGLTWSAFDVYDRGGLNQFTFPLTDPGMSDNNLTYITADAYCQSLGAGWRLPSLGELRTVLYLDGTTVVKNNTGTDIRYVWSDTPYPDTPNAKYVVKLNEYAVDGGITYDKPHFVTCVKE